MKLISLDPDWICQDGKGEDGESFSQKTKDNIDDCKSECLATQKCIALDFSEQSKSCRLFKENLLHENSVTDPRSHCSLGEQIHILF